MQVRIDEGIDSVGQGAIVPARKKVPPRHKHRLRIATLRPNLFMQQINVALSRDIECVGIAAPERVAHLREMGVTDGAGKQAGAFHNHSSLSFFRTILFKRYPHYARYSDLICNFDCKTHK